VSTRMKPVSPIVAYDLLAVSFRRSLEAANKSPRTVETYSEAVRLFGEFLKAHGMPTDPTAISREHVEAFIADLLANWKPATANNRYRALQQFFTWLEEEGEIPGTPMRHMRPPKVPETPPDVLDETQLRRLLKGLRRQGF
jgi:site-specific recombinase XerD